MAESFFELSRDDQREVLEQVRAKTERPTHLLEKDVWVIWTQVEGDHARIATVY